MAEILALVGTGFVFGLGLAYFLWARPKPKESDDDYSRIFRTLYKTACPNYPEGCWNVRCQLGKVCCRGLGKHGWLNPDAVNKARLAEGLPPLEFAPPGRVPRPGEWPAPPPVRRECEYPYCSCPTTKDCRAQKSNYRR